MSSVAWVKWCPRDFRASTHGWPLVARGAYRELLDVQFDMGWLPADERELQVLAGASGPEWKRAWPYLESKFPLWGDKRLNPRMKDEREDALRRHADAVENGRKGARKRWKTDNHPISHPNSNPNSNHNHNHTKNSYQGEGEQEVRNKDGEVL